MPPEEPSDRKKAQKILVASAEEVAEVVDAISGATWNTRNTIMEDLFHDDLAAHGDAMPAYRPPGEL